MCHTTRGDIGVLGFYVHALPLVSQGIVQLHALEGHRSSSSVSDCNHSISRGPNISNREVCLHYHNGCSYPHHRPILMGSSLGVANNHRVQRGQYGQQGQRGQQRQIGLAMVDVAHISRDNIGQTDGSIDDQTQISGIWRMYTTTTEEADQDVVIITSTFLNHSAPTVVLFDSGNTHTFLSRVFVDEIGVMIDD